MNKSSISKEDASPLTTSTESETFDTWTVITNQTTNLISEKIPSPPPTPDKMEPDSESTEDALRVEILSTNENDDQSVIRYVDSDDLSDGISIISECDSIGRISPQLRTHTSELNMRFVDVIESPLRMTMSVAGGDVTSRFYEAGSEHSSDGFHQMEPLMENNRRKPRASQQLADSSTDFRPTLRSGFKGLFIVGALLGILALVSKLRYEAVLGNTNTCDANQKIDELELKNNLMRAEIDILAKQVNYLSILAEKQKYYDSNKSKNNNPSKEKKMKVWPGNGNKVEDFEINPNDLKTPFKCDGHNNVDIAGVCIELPNSAKSLVDSLCDKVRSVVEENEQLAKLEKIVDTTAKTADRLEKNDDTTQENLKASIKESQQNKPEYTPHEHKSDKYENKKYDNKREHLKKHKNDDHSGESCEQYNRKDRSSEDFGGSGERIKKSKDYKKYDKFSSAEYENAKKDADGQWHEKLMKHRENSRKNNDKQRRDKNWYIERGDSREKARSSEDKYR